MTTATQTSTPKTERPRWGRASVVKPGETFPAHLVEMYEFMEAYIDVNKYPPTNREMVDHHFAKSTSVIRYYYERMVKYGMITVVPGVSRGIRLHPRKEWQKPLRTVVAIPQTKAEV